MAQTGQIASQRIQCNQQPNCLNKLTSYTHVCAAAAHIHCGNSPHLIATDSHVRLWVRENCAEPSPDRNRRPLPATWHLTSVAGTGSRTHSVVSRTRQSPRSRTSTRESLVRRCRTENGRRESWSGNAVTRRPLPQ